MAACVPYESRRPVYYEASQRDWQPMATYVFLGVMAAFFLAQNVVAGLREGLHYAIFVINTDFYLRPWTLVTSTFAHGGVGHLLFNGIFLFFFGPHLERIWGRKVFIAWFLIAGAVAGVLQVTLSELVTGASPGGLGASGALMMIMGALVIMMPKAQILIWGIIPAPFWAMAIGYAVFDVLGALQGGTGIGHFAHLSGMAIGALLGLRTKNRLAERGVRLSYE